MGSDLSVSVSDKEVYVGGTVTFECEVNKRGVSAEWKKGDDKLSGGNKYKMTSDKIRDGYKFSLTIRDVQLEDNGEYTIYVTRGKEKLSGTTTLIVRERLTIVKPIHDVKVCGGEKITLECEVNNDEATAKWLKNNKEVFESVNVTMTQNGKNFTLIIKQAQRSDDGTYTCEVTLPGEKVKCAADVIVREFEKEWRAVSWDINSKNKMIKEISSLKPKVNPIRILLHGPVGAGKSSFVNSIDTVFKGRVAGAALADAGIGTSFTTVYKTHQFQINGHPAFLPFVVNDIMGLEEKDSEGAHTDDIINALQGYIKDYSQLHSGKPMSKGDSGYNNSPTLADQAHCLVSVIPADKISLMDEAIIMKMRQIRKKASKMGVPQVVVMTMVDEACPLVKNDLRKIYTSLKIKEKMEECHVRLGVPMNCIFPVKNYHEEGSLVLDLDCLILTALTQIIHFANDYLNTVKANDKTVGIKPAAEVAKPVGNIKPTVQLAKPMANIRTTVQMDKPMATVKMPEPICLIDNDESGCMCVRREALEILEEITQPVVVVAIVGLYRTGKSFLMNRLAGKNVGFALGATIESKTKGIWMWCVPHPTKEGHTLVLLDTEGLGDVEKGDTKHDTWIFCLAVLLSSTLVYNSMQTINNDALEKLHYVTELTERIKVKSGSRNEDQSTEFMSFFPSFVWTVRDFTLNLELDGQPITADQYLDNALKLKPGSSKKTEQYNLPRHCLRQFFSPRKCFVFERPASGEKMKQMEQLTDSDLDPKFVTQVQDFCSYILTNVQAKTMREGLGLTGRMLGTLAETYVEAISSGQVPCLDNAVESLSQTQNKRAVTEALNFYQTKMKHKAFPLPTETQEDLSEIHTDIQREAVEIFINGSFNDAEQEHQFELMGKMQSVYEEYCRDNVEASRKMSKSAISRVFSSLETELKNGYYMQTGGYTEYRSVLEKATEQYRSEKGHGLMSEEVLNEYLSDKEQIGHIILAADKSLTESQQETERVRLKTVVDEQQRRAEQEQKRIKEQQNKDQQRTHDENVEQLLKKLEKEREIAKQELERVLNAKLKEQEHLLEQGFKDRAEKMQKEIDSLKEKKKNWKVSWSPIMKMMLKGMGAAVSILPGIGQIGGMALRAIAELLL